MKKRPVIRTNRNKTTEDLTPQLRERILNLPSDVKSDYLKEQVFSKFVSPDTDPPLTRRTRAINKWLATEMENSATNERLLFTHEEYNILPRVTFQRFVEHARHLIAIVIGDSAPIEALIGSFSGGASTSRTRTSSHPANKYLGEAHVTDRCYTEILPLVREELPLWLESEGLSFKIVPGNVLFTVPKKTDIDRCACKEPDINMFFQKGIGNYFRNSLRKVHINLRDQSINRRLAREGSLTGALATLDLSSASDSVSTGLVSLLLPECWYTLLDASRCQKTIIDGVEHGNEMFSSMGNGFTFELESMLFWALAKTTCHLTGVSGIVSVYGDDIICPSSVVSDLTWVLEYFGFQVNPDKSFSSGPFRESCGGHYHDGFDITPFYVKAPITTLVDVIHVANQLREWGTTEHHAIIDPTVEDIWLWLKSHVPKRLWGGGDTSFKFQLASYDVPSHVLQPERVRKGTGQGGYLHWHNATWNRDTSTEGVETSTRSEELSFYRERKVRDHAVARLPAHFYHEVC